MNVTKGIWQRQGDDQLSTLAYTSLVGISFFWTVAMVGVGTYISYGWRADFLSVLFAFIGAIVGMAIFSASDKPISSLLGVTILSFFLGLSIGPIIAYYNAETVLQALIMTGGVTLIMSLAGILFPSVMKGAGGILFILLSLVIVGYFAGFIFALLGVTAILDVLDYVIAGLFSIYIWYDWSRAMSLPKSVDNAIDASGALILDIVNLFLALLRIIGRSNR